MSRIILSQGSTAGLEPEAPAGVGAAAPRRAADRPLNAARSSAAPCDAVAFPSREPLPDDLPRHILVAPFGEVRSAHGAFVVDEEAMRLTVETFAAQGTDLPIDFEHQSLGGPYSSPSGLAPAAGWIRQLHAVAPLRAGRADAPRGPADAASGLTDAPPDAGAAPRPPGLWAEVEWTPLAAEHLRSRQYRYLSPVALVRRADRRMIGLHSAALTNKPAIVGMSPLVARADSPAVGAAPAGGAWTPADGAGLPPRDAADPGDPTGDHAPAEAARRAAARRDAFAVANADAPSDLHGDVQAGCGATQADAGRILDAAAGPAAGPGGLARLRSVLSLPADHDAEAVLALAAEKIGALAQVIRGREASDLVELAAAAGKLGPRQREWALALALRDPAAFTDWFHSAPQIVPLGRMAPPAAAAESRRTALERRARDEYRRHADFLGKLCTEEAYVADAVNRRDRD